MQYADSVHQVLLRKINRAEQELVQLKLDYCRFIFGLTYRSKVEVDGQRYQVASVDVDSMTRAEDGSFNRPEIAGTPVDQPRSEPCNLGNNWLVSGSAQDARGQE